MRLLVAVKSCVRDALRGDEDCVRQSWGKYLPENVDLRFFLGLDLDYLSDGKDKNDEVIVDVPDDYDSLPHKSRAIFAWALNNNYDYVFACDNDTYLIPSRLMACGFDRYDFSGRFGAMPKLGTTFDYKDPRGVYKNYSPWPSGGVGYFVSKKAATIIADTEPMCWAEDMFAGQVLGPHIQRGEIKAADLSPFEGHVSWHFPRREYNNSVFLPDFKWHERMLKEHPCQ